MMITIIVINFKYYYYNISKYYYYKCAYVRTVCVFLCMCVCYEAS